MVDVAPGAVLVVQCDAGDSLGELAAMRVDLLQRGLNVWGEASQHRASDPDEHEDHVLLPNGMWFDFTAVPQLHDSGCEDVYNWTNGNAACADQAKLIGSVDDRSSKDAFCKATGYTCAAYAMSGSCGTARWPIGSAFNHPESSCCACGGGTTAEQLSADCGEPTPECQRSIKLAMELNVRDHHEMHVALSNKPSIEAVQLDLSRLPNAVCKAPCGLKPICHTTVKGEACYRHVVWARKVGIFRHPKWFAGLSSTSRIEEFQEKLAKTHGLASQCSMPCLSGAERFSAKATGGCPRLAYNGPKNGSAFCFSQLAGNSLSHACSCPQGCNLNRVLLASSSKTVTFKNLKFGHASNGACSSVLLLTCPRDYFEYINDIKSMCSREDAVSRIEGMLWDAFVAFNDQVCRSVVWQCFHSPQTASVPYSHLQTFAENVFFHGLPTSNPMIGFCVRQRHGYESRDLAAKLVDMM
eukprot:TRINITY_DN14846_c0_g2_i1.p1 TRINITY_DN14846_c0_g2~~TRINITY_DN14846_c0_g2_i1.p1  ORF type:complete len:511 (+),score=39.86 TRINITY_DN14846_c0_g2_i1:130-1533(+)